MQIPQVECSGCGNQVSSIDTLCPNCGYPVYKSRIDHPDTQPCPKCGNKRTHVTQIKGLFGNSKPAFGCNKCGYKWPWPHGKRYGPW